MWRSWLRVSYVIGFRFRGHDFEFQSKTTSEKVMDKMYGNSLPNADSKWAVVRYLRKYVHLVLINCLEGFGLPRNRVKRFTDRLDMNLIVLTWLKISNN